MRKLFLAVALILALSLMLLYGLMFKAYKLINLIETAPLEVVYETQEAEGTKQRKLDFSEVEALFSYLEEVEYKNRYLNIKIDDPNVLYFYYIDYYLTLNNWYLEKYDLEGNLIDYKKIKIVSETPYLDGKSLV